MRNPTTRNQLIAEPFAIRWGSLLSVALILLLLQRYEKKTENPLRIRLNKPAPLYIDSV